MQGSFTAEVTAGAVVNAAPAPATPAPTVAPGTTPAPSGATPVGGGTDEEDSAMGAVLSSGAGLLALLCALLW